MDYKTKTIVADCLLRLCKEARRREMNIEQPEFALQGVDKAARVFAVTISAFNAAAAIYQKTAILISDNCLKSLFTLAKDAIEKSGEKDDLELISPYFKKIIKR